VKKMSERKAEIKELKRLGRTTKDTRMKLRYDVIRLYLQDKKKAEIAELLNTTYQTVTNYINAYAKYGLNGLIMKTSPGRRKKLTAEQEQQLYTCISTKLPNDVGFEPFVNWTAPLARQWVKKEFGVEFTERGMRDVFYRLKLSYTRPTYVLKKADPIKQEAFKEQFEHLKKN
jgi:putative transposase